VGEVFVPSVNVALGISCVVLVLVFRSSDRLAAAYGLAVSATMLATSIAFYAVVTQKLRWKKRVTLPLVVLFVAIDGTFVAASLPKFLDGAWVPLAEYLVDAKPTLPEPKGTMVFLTGDPAGVPFMSSHRWLRARAEEERVVMLTLVRSLRPYVSELSRVSVENVQDRLTIVRAMFGYMERPNVKPVLRGCRTAGLDLDSDETSFFYAEAKMVPGRAGDSLPFWQRAYFAFLFRNARPLPDDLGIRANRRIEIGVEVEI
jgi:KUP system potassium uptake protein